MKEQLNDRYWIERRDLNKVAVGITASYARTLGVIWAFVPRHTNVLTKDKPFANVESAHCLGPLRSPIDGKLLSWNGDFLIYPDKIHPNEYLFIAEQQ